MRKFFTIYEEAVSLCNCSILNFLIYEENLLSFFIIAQAIVFSHTKGMDQEMNTLYKTTYKIRSVLSESADGLFIFWLLYLRKIEWNDSACFMKTIDKSE
jgi:hypothetical protein